MPRTLRLTGYARTAHELTYGAEIAGRSFTTRCRYDSLDLLELERRHGGELLRSLYFHAIAFDLNRLVSLKPDRVDFGPFRELVTDEFTELWRRIFDGVWAQWRYENDLPQWAPELNHRPHAPQRPTTAGGVERYTSGGPATLLFCGGGKDSLLAARLFEEIGEPFDSLAYSHSLYGADAAQHALIDRLLDHCRPRRRHRLHIRDDLRPAELDLDALGVRSFTAAETPSALFLALPLALGHGFTNLVVAHEKSADLGNLIWDATGEEINHQWGKSLEAEALLADYLARHLLPGVHYWSVLKPLHDAVIFPALGGYLEAIPDTHSCNVAKPWCRRCAKCAYVFLGYAAWLPREVVLETFGENLLDVEENLDCFAGLLGLGEHLPFECVGRVEESRLLLALAARRGWTGLALERFRDAVERELGAAPITELCAARDHPHRIPGALAVQLVPALERRARTARRLLDAALGG